MSTVVRAKLARQSYSKTPWSLFGYVFFFARALPTYNFKLVREGYPLRRRPNSLLVPLMENGGITATLLERQMSCSICAMVLVDHNGDLASGSFGDGEGEGAGIRVPSVSSAVEGGATAAATKTCYQSRCSCKRFLHNDCATTWLKVSPRCHR